MQERPSEPELDVWRAFLRAHATVIKALEGEMLAEQNLPLTWYEILLYLAAAPGRRLRLQALADSLLLSRSGITRLVDRLAQVGLVRREPCPDDRRGSYAALTDQGLTVLRQAAPGHLRGIVTHFTRHLRPEELAILQGLFNRVLQAEENRYTGDDTGDCLESDNIPAAGAEASSALR